MVANANLAIVIPAYKAEYLADALHSLSNQTDKRFRVYVGDDASPGPIKEICSQFQDKLDLFYERFTKNLGRNSLVDQWHRCIQLSSEPWIWLFSDDDKMEPGCIEAFYKTLEKTKGEFDLYRFNTLTIGEQGEVIRISPPHPLLESGLEFAYHRLCRKRASFVSEYIFSREVFDLNNGMVNFPLAWCSDDASWILFSGRKGIFTIYGPKVFWRKSQLNISFAEASKKALKIDACGQFLDWLYKRYDSNAISRELGVEIGIFNECCNNWLKFHFEIQAPLGPKIYYKLYKDNKFSMMGSPIRRFASALYIDIVFFIRSLFKNIISFF